MKSRAHAQACFFHAVFFQSTYMHATIATSKNKWKRLWGCGKVGFRFELASNSISIQLEGEAKRMPIC